MSAKVGSLTNTVIGVVVCIVVLGALWPVYSQQINAINWTEMGGMGTAAQTILQIAYPALMLGLAIGIIYKAFQGFGTSGGKKRSRRRR
mgnify:CR=1 FL=1